MKKIFLLKSIVIYWVVTCVVPCFSFGQTVPVSIYPSPVVTYSYPLQDNGQYLSFNNNLYFVASGFTHMDWELWKTNGDLNGTTKIKTLYSGTTACSTNPVLSKTNSKIFFQAFDPNAGEELWISDGTNAGTQLLKDINPGIAPSCLGSFAAKGDTLFFVADDGVHGSELWMSDGTPAGTKMVLDTYTVPLSGSGLNISDPLTVVNGIVYFSANNFFNGLELWRSDGSAAGTFMVKDINPGSAGSGYCCRNMFQVGNKFYFVANDGVNGMEPWISDGTNAGTLLVKNINPGSSASNTSFMNNIGDSLVYFKANDGLYGTEFWRSNGTLNGTYMLKDFNIGSGNGYFSSFFEFNNEYYIAVDFTSAGPGWKLYKTDIFLNTFGLIKSISAAAAFSNGNSIIFANRFYFGADDGTNGNELWVSDGTTSGTNMVQNIHPAGSSNPSRFTLSNAKLFFIAFTGNTNNGSLHKLDNCQPIVISGTTDTITGSININVTGGVQPYFSFVWSNGNTTQNITGLTQGTYTVTVYDNTGCSSSKSFFLNSTVGLKENNYQHSIVVFPNPFSIQTTLQVTEQLVNATLTVGNCLGQTVAQIKGISGSTIVFNRDNLPSGLYFFRLSEKNKTIVVNKFVVINK